jgi:membrane protein required for colicin V production
MNALDVAVLGVVALSALFAFARGFVREALSIVAWVGAAAVTLYGFNYVYAITVRFLTTPLLADLVAGAGLFVASLIVLTIITGVVARWIHFTALSPIDRTLGLVFGIVRGALLVSLAYLLLDISVPQSDWPVWIQGARSQPLLAEGAGMLREVLPESLKVKSAATADEAQRAVDRAHDYQRAMRALANPTEPAKPGQPPAPSYKPGDRQDMDRVIQTVK